MKLEIHAAVDLKSNKREARWPSAINVDYVRTGKCTN